MSLVRASHSLQEDVSFKPVKSPWRRSLILGVLFLLALGATVVLAITAPPPDTSVTFFIWVWIISFLPYVAACIFVLRTKAGTGRWQWVELGIILVGALLLRAMLLPIPPDLSHDSWRYLWDARVTLHGYSPYVYAPDDPLLLHLRDFIYGNSRFRNVPTLYPPGAEAIYLISYLLAPSNLIFLKGMFMVFDLVTCVALAFFLQYRGLDPARAVIYAWSPLPIVEFAIQGHVDAVTLTFTLLAVLCSLSNRQSMRILTGFLIAMATLTKIYPILLLVVVVRRRGDWALIATCFITIIASYLPYIILGHGQVFGFFSTYANEHTPNEGITKLVIGWLGPHIGLSATLTLILEYLVDLFTVCSVSLLILVLRLRERISKEAAMLVLIGIAFAVSSHIFSWYTTVLLLWVAMLVEPLWTRTSGLNSKGLAVAMAWYFASVSITSYFFESVRDWSVYYWLVYDVMLIGLGIAAIKKYMDHYTIWRMQKR